MKILAPILALLILLETSGVFLNSHTCTMSGKTDVTLSLLPTAANNCCGDTNDNNGCCKNQFKLFKLNSQFIQKQFSVTHALQTEVVEFLLLTLLLPQLHGGSQISFHLPPLVKPSSILHCILRC